MIQNNQLWALHSDAQPIQVAPGMTRRILAHNDNIMGVEHSFDTGAVGVLHSHPHTQLTYVVKGVFSFTVNGETKVIHPGDSMLKADNQVHGCTCLEEGILLEVFTPMRKDFI